MSGHPGLIYDCPNCTAEHQGFAFLWGYDHPAKGLDKKNTIGHREFLLFECSRCHFPVVVEMHRNCSDHVKDQALQLEGGYQDSHYKLLSIRPKRPRIDGAPEHTPENIANFFAQGCRALQRGDADAAGMSFRKALDAATRNRIRAINPPDLDTLLKRKLKGRIEWLHGRGKLTDDLAAWAHLMRDEGNDAAHEEKPYTLEEAKDLHQLTEVFLMYVFTVPGKIAEWHPNLEVEMKAQEPGTEAREASAASPSESS